MAKPQEDRKRGKESDVHFEQVLCGTHLLLPQTCGTHLLQTFFSFYRTKYEIRTRCGEIQRPRSCTLRDTWLRKKYVQKYIFGTKVIPPAAAPCCFMALAVNSPPRPPFSVTVKTQLNRPSMMGTLSKSRQPCQTPPARRNAARSRCERPAAALDSPGDMPIAVSAESSSTSTVKLESLPASISEEGLKVFLMYLFPLRTSLSFSQCGHLLVADLLGLVYAVVLWGQKNTWEDFLRKEIVLFGKSDVVWRGAKEVGEESSRTTSTVKLESESVYLLSEKWSCPASPWTEWRRRPTLRDSVLPRPARRPRRWGAVALSGAGRRSISWPTRPRRSGPETVQSVVRRTWIY